MRGYRKIIIAILIVAVAAFVALNQHQAAVLIAVAWATLGSNAAINVGGQIAKAMGKRRTGRTGSRASVPRNEERPWEGDEGRGPDTDGP